jgi:quercetin dioxygenase-like cupin family protein
MEENLREDKIMLEAERFRGFVNGLGLESLRNISYLAQINVLVGCDLRAEITQRLVRDGLIPPGRQVRYNETLTSHPNSDAMYFLEQDLKATIPGQRKRSDVRAYASFIPPYSRTSDHYHPSHPVPVDEYYEVLYGRLIIGMIVEGRFKQHELARGDMITISPGTLHQAYTTPDSFAVLYLKTNGAPLYLHDKLHIRPVNYGE